MKNWIAQGIGFAGLAFALLSFQRKERKGILFFQTVASLSFFFHYFILCAYTGSVMNLLAATRNIVFYHKEKKWASKRYWLYLFITIYIISTVFTWKSNYSILPLIGVVVGTISFWMKSPRLTRLIILISPPCWFIYDLFSGSIPGMITEIFTFTSILETTVFRKLISICLTRPVLISR